MNYQKIYWKIITNAVSDRLLLSDEYTEKHHIFPKSIYGKNDATVELTGKEHIVAHHLLWKHYEKTFGKKDDRTRKMFWAFYFMIFDKRKKIKMKPYQYSSFRKLAGSACAGDNSPMRRPEVKNNHSGLFKER